MSVASEVFVPKLIKIGSLFFKLWWKKIWCVFYASQCRYTALTALGIRQKYEQIMANVFFIQRLFLRFL